MNTEPPTEYIITSASRNNNLCLFITVPLIGYFPAKELLWAVSWSIGIPLTLTFLPWYNNCVGERVKKVQTAGVSRSCVFAQPRSSLTILPLALHWTRNRHKRVKHAHFDLWPRSLRKSKSKVGPKKKNSPGTVIITKSDYAFSLIRVKLRRRLEQSPGTRLPLLYIRTWKL